MPFLQQGKATAGNAKAPSRSARKYEAISHEETPIAGFEPVAMRYDQISG
jgi:hypothetical protein